MGYWGIVFWLPQVLRDPGNGGPGRGQVTVALLSVIPNALATVAGIVAAWNSDRTREVRPRRRAAHRIVRLH